MPEHQPELEKWLRARCMSTVQFCRSIGCSRQIGWKIKKGKVISHDLGKKVIQFTHGEVIPNFRKAPKRKRAA